MEELVRRAEVSAWSGDVAGTLARGLGPGPFAEVLLFCSPKAEIGRIAQGAALAWPGARVVGCTTAGEIGAGGYTEETVVALGLPTSHFAVETVFLPDLGGISREGLVAELIRARERLAQARPLWPGEFAFVMVDGLSMREDELAAALAMGLGPVPLFGGSAGDGLDFRATFVIAGGRVWRDAAVVSFVRTACGVRVFSLDHLVPSEVRMVVTEADPSARVVRQINAEPAALAYARLLGKDPGQLTTFTFAAHPVVVRLGGRHHVRSIQRMLPNGDLVFFSAIDEGLVLRLAEPMNMARHLEDELDRLGQPGAILACDCILRRIEAEEKQVAGELSRILQRHRVTGFSTYGEQFGALHVNQTMTGVALYAPGSEGAPCAPEA
ncbi:FIST N-terminal domain-containing protein [Stagnihabitans tardus]|uniref:GfdT protein n=1 Tax=Stagnihabitans tardus TaxID=2699202 RepID=A0AAE4Y8H9_9RHOB|nr:FIST N-terminal domain-containing protein [Stagnihabitans tardus]NBZ87122.1 GfdT protein [Stagnihabitans tardus]